MLYRPVFVDGDLAFFTAALLHVADLGGMAAGGLPANATEMYHEGLIIPPVRLYHAGRSRRGGRRHDRGQQPHTREGAGRPAGHGGRGQRRRPDGSSTSPAATVWRPCCGCARSCWRTPNAGPRADLAALPDGSHEGSFTIDDDGVEEGKDHVVRVRVTIDGDRVIADFAGTDAQARGPINASMSQSMSGVLYAVRCLAQPRHPRQ